ncbi:MAG TPA: CbiX/SirB N-terminal domain-containing protein [Pseudolysinimonas sp.]|nr:CbiX/SirB N-terminal domain-containing protein [Pseudolysinimonas sp.]
MSLAPALVGISHGTSSDEGRRAVSALLEAVRLANPELVIAEGFVDVQHPDPTETLAGLPPGQDAVVVPLLLSAGYHVHVDLTNAIAAETERRVTLAPPLGPDERLVEVLKRRLDAVAFSTSDTLVLAVAGSSDTRAVADCRIVAHQLGIAIGHDVTLGFLSAAQPRLDAAIAETRATRGHGRIVVSSYLLAPGYFQDLAAAAGGDTITAPLLNPQEPTPTEIVDIVVDRYRAGIATI